MKHTPLFTLLIVCLLSCCGFGSCEGQLTELCQGQLQASYDNALLALRPWQQVESSGAPSRSPASVDALKPGPTAPMMLRDREQWANWSATRLKEVQNLQDKVYGVGSLSAVHAELGLVANKLVAFYGYSSQGRVDQMISVLQQIQAHKDKIRTLACH